MCDSVRVWWGCDVCVTIYWVAFTFILCVPLTYYLTKSLAQYAETCNDFFDLLGFLLLSYRYVWCEMNRFRKNVLSERTFFLRFQKEPSFYHFRKTLLLIHQDSCFCHMSCCFCHMSLVRNTKRSHITRAKYPHQNILIEPHQNILIEPHQNILIEPHQNFL